MFDCLEQWDLPYYNWRDEEGFHWTEVFNDLAGIAVMPSVEHFTDEIPPSIFEAAMAHPRAKAGFERDMRHLREASCLILLLPCGKSAHLEAGYAAGAGIPTALYTAQQPLQPELMYGMLDLVTDSIHDLMTWTHSMHLQANPVPVKP